MKLPRFNKDGQQLHIAIGQYFEMTYPMQDDFQSKKELDSFMKQRYYANKGQYTYFYA